MPSSIPTYILTPDELVPTPYTVYSLAEAVTREPQGVYTVARTFHGDHALLFGAHLDRLEESARLSGIALRLDRDRLRAAMREVLHRAGYADAKFRIVVPKNRPECFYLAFEPYQPVPEAVQRQGAYVATVPLVRQNPAVKTTEWMTVRRPAYERLPQGVYEGLLRREDGALLEGMSSNFYSVLDGVLHTSDDGVLQGITRKAILEIAPSILPVRLTPVFQSDIPRLSEALLTSSGRGVVPITMIDGMRVGSGEVGPVASEIRRRYGEWAEAHLEPI